MKKPIILIILSILSIQLISKTQNIINSKTVANNFFHSKSQNLKLTDSYPIKKINKNLIYIFNYEPSSFVAVSADNVIFPIIAYSFKNSIQKKDIEQSLLIKILKQDISRRLKYFQNFPAAAEKNQQKWKEFLSGNTHNRDFQQWPVPGSTITDGWIETRWTQEGIYDNFCPLDNEDERCKVGCVATAMAQIVNFHEYLGNISFDNSDDYYAGNGIDIDDDHNTRDFPSFPELNGYLLDLWNHYEHGVELTDDDKAALSFACGVTVEMQFSANGSSASTTDVVPALLNKFDFDSAEYLNMYWNFYPELAENMINMQPVQLSIYNPAEQIGHSIICDGYNTDEYFHLNLGWGSSDETCWYLLPDEIPDGYSIVNGGVFNIEGGETPFIVSGNIEVQGVSTIGTYIKLEGEYSYETYCELLSGDFEFPAVMEGFYTATAILDERVYFESFDIYLDENNDYIQFDLGHFEAVTGTISAPVNPENCFISLYQDETMLYSGITGENGEFSIPDVLPGEYLATACLDGNYFQSQNVTITLENQTIDFVLDEYPGNLAISYSGYVDDVWNFVPNYTLTCAIKLTPEELIEHENDLISKIRFKSPINPEDGFLFAQVWNEDDLISEKEITDFSAGEWLEVVLNNYIMIETSYEYYIGYKIQSATGVFSYHDANPRVVGKGAFTRSGGWTELPLQNDFNFCIDAILVSQEFGTIQGNIELSSGSGDIIDAVIKTQNYISHPAENGFYSFDLKSGIYDLTASLKGYSSATIENITLQNDELVENQDFVLDNTHSDESFIIDDENLIRIFPNPALQQIEINYYLKEDAFVCLEIFNLKGQKIKTLVSEKQNKGNYNVQFDGLNNLEKTVSSGIYFIKLSLNKNTTFRKIVIF